MELQPNFNLEHVKKHLAKGGSLRLSFYLENEENPWNRETNSEMFKKNEDRRKKGNKITPCSVHYDNLLPTMH